MDTKQAQVNTFIDGLNTDLHPLNISNTLLTDCINGTIITNDGHEPILQNDQGNEEITCKLDPNYIPVAVKEWNDILYIVSYNPEKKDTQYGSFPSVLRSDYSNQVGKSTTFKVDLSDFYDKLDKLEENNFEVNYSDVKDLINFSFSIAEKTGANTITVSPSNMESFTYIIINTNNTSTFYYTSDNKEIANIPNGAYSGKLDCITLKEIDSSISGSKVLDISNNYVFTLNLDSTLTIVEELNEPNIVSSEEIQSMLFGLELEIEYSNEKKIINSENPLKFESTLVLSSEKNLSEITITPRLPFVYKGTTYYIVYDQLSEKISLSHIKEVSYFGNSTFKYYFKENFSSSDYRYNIHTIIDFQRPSGLMLQASTIESSLKPIILTENNQLDENVQAWTTVYNGWSSNYSNVEFTYKHNSMDYKYYWLHVEVTLEDQRYNNTTVRVKADYIIINDEYFYDSYLNIDNYNTLYLDNWVAPITWDKIKLSMNIKKLESTLSEKSIDTANLKSLGTYTPRFGYTNLPTDEDIIENLPKEELVTGYVVDITGGEGEVEGIDPKVGYEITYYIGENYSKSSDLGKNLKIADTYTINLSSKSYLCPEYATQEHSNIGKHLYNINLFRVVTKDNISYISIKFKDPNETDIKEGVIKINGDFEMDQTTAEKVCSFLNMHIYKNEWINDLYKYIIKVPEDAVDNLICYTEDSYIISDITCQISPKTVYFYNTKGDTIVGQNIIDNPENYGFEGFNNLNPITSNDTVVYSLSKDFNTELKADSISMNEKTMLENYLNDYFIKLPTTEQSVISEDLGSALIHIKLNSANDYEFESYIDKYPSNYNLDILKDVNSDGVLIISESKILDSNDASEWKNKLDIGIDIDDNLNNIYCSGEYLNE